MIREVRESDAHAAWRLFAASLGYSCEEDVVRKRIAELAGDPRCISLVWEDETGEVLGLVHGIRYDTLHSEGGWDVISLAVLPEAQRRGVGRELLRAFEERARDAGGTFVRLNSRTERTEAHKFYEHVGYTCGKVQKYFSRPLSSTASEAEV